MADLWRVGGQRVRFGVGLRSLLQWMRELTRIHQALNTFLGSVCWRTWANNKELFAGFNGDNQVQYQGAFLTDPRACDCARPASEVALACIEKSRLLAVNGTWI